MRRDIELRFWEKVDKSNKDGCWLWTANTKHSGYGQFHGAKGPMSASRYAYLSVNGPLLEGELVMHTCDNPPCCNPAHLKKGSYYDNSLDMIQKGRDRKRGPRGERSSKSKLTASQVIEIRSRYPAERITKLGPIFGVSPNSIWRIITRQSWDHLP